MSGGQRWHGLVEAITEEIEVDRKASEVVSEAREAVARLSTSRPSPIPGVNLERERLTKRERDWVGLIQQLLRVHDALRFKHEHLLQRYELVVQFSQELGAHYFDVITRKGAEDFLYARGWHKRGNGYVRPRSGHVIILDPWDSVEHRRRVLVQLAVVHNLTLPDVWVDMVLGSGDGVRLGAFDAQHDF